MAPRDHVERYFRAIVPEHAAVPVGPFGTGLFLRPIDGRVQGVVGQWGMIQPQARARRPESRAILTNNAYRNSGDPPDLPSRLGRRSALPDPGPPATRSRTGRLVAMSGGG